MPYDTTQIDCVGSKCEVGCESAALVFKDVILSVIEHFTFCNQPWGYWELKHFLI